MSIPIIDSLNLLTENEVLFPSIPVDIALKVLENHLNGINLDNDEQSVYIETTGPCMNQSYFEFRSKIYKVEFGRNMGNPPFFVCPDLLNRYKNVNQNRLHLEEANEIILPNITKTCILSYKDVK